MVFQQLADTLIGGQIFFESSEFIELTGQEKRVVENYTLNITNHDISNVGKPNTFPQPGKIY